MGSTSNVRSAGAAGPARGSRRLRLWTLVAAVTLLAGGCSGAVQYFPPWGPAEPAPSRRPIDEVGEEVARAERAPADTSEQAGSAAEEEATLAGRDELVYGPQREPLTDAEQRQLASNLALAGELQDRGLDAYASRDGVVITLADVLFEFGSAELTDQARRQLRDVAEVLLGDGRGRRVEVGGHTDAIGAELYNLALSERRAKAVAKALIAEGVSEALLVHVGYGSEHPIAPNSNPDGSDNPAGRALNRRVEVVIFN